MNNLKKICQQIRADILISTTNAGSGHPTSSLSPVELMVTLFFDDFLNSHDRVIFSKGHAAPLLYALYHQKGIITDEQLMSLRQIDSPLEGHPVPKLPFIDVATGSLGQGLSAGLGLALAGKLQITNNPSTSLRVNKSQTNSNKQISNIYVLLGDSEMAEGQIWEAVQIASYYKLNNLVAILDVNRLGQRGETMLGWDVKKYEQRLKAFDWNTIVVDDGHDLEKVKKAFEQVKEYQKGSKSPTAIIAKTVKGKGVSFLENKDSWHGKVLSKEQLKIALKEIEITIGGAKKGVPTAWSLICGQTNPGGNEFGDRIYRYKNGFISTREAYGDALVKIGETDKRIVVLDAEVGNSTYSERFKERFPDRFFEMFIAEQNMVTTALGLSAMGQIPFLSTFAAFLTRAFDQIRMSQYSNANLKIIGSHAGCHIGADGPSQMGLEDIAIMRSILKSTVFYPSDVTSTKKIVAIMAKIPGICYLRTTREKTPIIYSDKEDFTVGGSKIHYPKNNKTQIQAIIVAAGITLHETLKAQQELAKENINVIVVDCYSVKPIDTVSLKRLTKTVKQVIVIEDHYPNGGLGDAVREALINERIEFHHLAVNKIPGSATPEEQLSFEEIDSQAIIKKIKTIV